MDMVRIIIAFVEGMVGEEIFLYMFLEMGKAMPVGIALELHNSLVC
jgi:hypothetical protein